MANAFVCRVELSKTDGITVKLTDDKGKVTQSIEMDGKTITTTFKGKKKTSTITQKDESIVIKVTGDKGTSTITQNEEDGVSKADLEEYFGNYHKKWNWVLSELKRVKLTYKRDARLEGRRGVIYGLKLVDIDGD